MSSSRGSDGMIHLVFMGVSGSGKSAIGRPVVERLRLEFAEGDDFHPAANVEKMSAGWPLNDEDRWPWLRLLAEWTRRHHDANTSTAITCSALKRSYRDVLREGGDGTCFVHLTGDKGVVLERMGRREHFMAPTMLESQLDTLQPLGDDEHGFAVDVADPVDVIVDEVIARVTGS